MRDFIDLVESLDATTGTNEKIRRIADYLQSADPADAAWAVYLLTDQRKKRTVPSGTLKEIFMSHTSLPGWLFSESHAQVGDTAETVTLLIRADYLDRASADAGGESDLETRPLHSWMEEAVPSLARLDRESRAARVVSWWRRVPADQLFVLNKLLTGGFRLGVAKGTVVKAIATATAVPETAVTEYVTGGFTPRADFLQGLQSAADDSSTKPYPFYLASPLPNEIFGAGELSDWRIEWKWDGIRAQIIRRGGDVAIWSRGEDLVTDQFPDIVAAAAALPDGTVLDAELLAWSPGAGDGDEARGGPAPFYVLQRRLGRKRVSPTLLKEAPAVTLVFDCLEEGGRDIRALALEERIAARDRVLAAAAGTGGHSAEDVATPQMERLLTSDDVDIDSWEELERLRRESRSRNVEGFLLKRRGSPYGRGRKRGDWWKFKRDPMSLDAVLIYAQAGSGKRANLFTDYSFALRGEDGLVPFAKAYSGLSNEEIAELDRWIRRHTTERFGPVRQVEPLRVFEIGFEDLVPSSRHKSGVATRFPRILRPRPDKSADEINTLEDARSLIQ